MPLAEALVKELQQEAKATRVALSRIPDDKLTWKPHEKSMTLGRLAQHIATLPGGVARVGAKESMAMEEFSGSPEPASTAAVLAAFDENVTDAASVIGGMGDAELAKTWTMTKGGQPVLSIPRIALYRTILLNHLYHHRGQLTVYLRLLDVPVPSIYGPSADENPFA